MAKTLTTTGQKHKNSERVSEDYIKKHCTVKERDAFLNFMGVDLTPSDDVSDTQEVWTSSSASSALPNERCSKQKRRWSDHELKLLSDHFGYEIAMRYIPSSLRIAELARKMQTRTVAQIRSQLHNIARRRSRFD